MIPMTVAILATALTQDHPRLLFGREDVPALRERIKKEPHKSMADHLKAGAEVGNWGRNWERPRELHSRRRVRALTPSSASAPLRS